MLQPAAVTFKCQLSETLCSHITKLSPMRPDTRISINLQGQIESWGPFSTAPMGGGRRAQNPNIPRPDVNLHKARVRGGELCPTTGGAERSL